MDNFELSSQDHFAETQKNLLEHLERFIENDNLEKILDILNKKDDETGRFYIEDDHFWKIFINVVYQKKWEIVDIMIENHDGRVCNHEDLFFSLAFAAILGKEALVQALLEMRDETERFIFLDEQCDTVFGLAGDTGQWQIVQMMIANHSDRLSSKYLAKVLSYAANSTDLEIVQALLDLQDENGNFRIFSISNFILQALCCERWQILQMIIHNYNDRISDEDLGKILKKSIRYEQRQIVKILMRDSHHRFFDEDFGEVLEFIIIESFLILCEADKIFRLKTVKLLLDLQDEMGNFVVSHEIFNQFVRFAAENRCWPVLQMLIEDADYSNRISNEVWETILEYARETRPLPLNILQGVLDLQNERGNFQVSDDTIGACFKSLSKYESYYSTYSSSNMFKMFSRYQNRFSNEVLEKVLKYAEKAEEERVVQLLLDLQDETGDFRISDHSVSNFFKSAASHNRCQDVLQMMRADADSHDRVSSEVHEFVLNLENQ